MSNEERFKKEKQYLETVKNSIDKEIKHHKKEIPEIPKRYRKRYSGVSGGDEKLIDHLLSVAYDRIKKLENSKGSPYFGRIDFLEDGAKKEAKLYIGKVSLLDDNANSMVLDWRAPICSLYYEQGMGKVSYTAPDGKISGDLKLKSQIIINDGELIEVRDVDFISEDELLKPYLGTSADNRMKNIIASIQHDQNKIIRKPLRKNLIIQGVAGSGKTTVALHRIAYLLYDVGDEYKAEQFLVIGPNKYFMNYISSLLPDLEADKVEQITFNDIAEDMIEDKITLKNQSESLLKYLESKEYDPNLKYKTSLNYKNTIDKFIKEYIDSSLSGDFKIDDFVIFDEDRIKEEILNGRNSYKNNADKFMKKSINYIKQNSEEIYDKIYEYYRKQFKALPMDDPKKEEIFKKLDDIKSQLKKGCSKEIKKYFKNLNIKTLSLYKKFINDFDKHYDKKDNVDLKSFKKETISSINKKNINYEDLPALMYISYKLNGFDKYNKMAHVVMDESQDYGMFHYYILKQLFKNSTFSIFGDLAQSIYSYRSIDNWEDVKDIIFESDCEIIDLEKSYRTTIEIMNNANYVSKELDIKPALPVIRHGEEVNFADISDISKDDYVIKRIADLLEKGYKSIAIICKTEEEANLEYNNLIKRGIKAVKITDKDEQYTGGICVLTSYLSKGLEFDAVIINNASENVYNVNSKTDMQLLYVALTRPLHEIDVLYSNNLTIPLKQSLMKDNYQKVKTR